VRDEDAIVLVFALVIMAGVALMISAMFNRRRYREMEHRERLAMIERGLIPSPERNPAAFESAAGLRPFTESAAGARYRTAGVLLIGIGLGLMMLLTFAVHDLGVGLGVGGAWAVLGGASLLNYSLISRRDRDYSNWHSTPRRSEPPSNIAP
jgi:Flp pilus assembly protein TadB